MEDSKNSNSKFLIIALALLLVGVVAYTIYNNSQNKMYKDAVEAEKNEIATNLDSIAYISINGKNIKLNLIERKFDEYSKKEENYTEIFSNKKFKATIEVKINNTNIFLQTLNLIKYRCKELHNKGIINK